jgi:HD-GYP domain-containing protein (c-di-GMP phosphodiesterase class II)
MTSDRPYRDALTADEAERRLEAEAGHQLDPQVVGALLSVVRRRRGAQERIAA